MKAIFKIMRGYGAEELLVNAGLCLEGTAKKIFGERLTTTSLCMRCGS